MNVIAIDIGNTNITVGLFVKDQEKFIEHLPGGENDKLQKLLISAWEQIDFVEGAKVKKRDGVIVVSSVKDEWTEVIGDICKDSLDEKIKVIGRDVSLPIEMGIDNPSEVGTDRVVSAAAAFAVIEDAVVIADFGTAVTIDLVDEEGVFLGGVIAPGFEMGAKALAEGTARLPKIDVTVANRVIGGNTADAINAGLYYSAVGLLETVTRKFAEEIGRWPQIIVTGGSAGIIKENCEFVDSWVPNLAVRGVVLAYKKHLADKEEFIELEDKTKEKDQ